MSSLIKTILFLPRLAIRVLLALPRLVAGTRRYRMPRGFSKDKVLQQSNVESPAVKRGFSPIQGFLEQLRQIYSKIIDENGPNACVAFCSPNRGEGKSTIAANLAVVMALDLNREITLVDLNLRNPSLHQLLDVEPEKGICDMQAGDDPTDFLTESRVPGLRLLAAGQSPDNPVRFLNSGITERVINDLTRRGHFVIVDTPAVNSFIDARLTAAETTGVITVVKLGFSKRFQLAAYYRNLDGANLLGVICNYNEYWIPAWLYRLV